MTRKKDSTMSNNQKSSRREEKKVDVNPSIRLPKPPAKVYNDNIDDHFVDVLRARVKKKEANALLYNSSDVLDKNEEAKKK
jgi:hypothetical protein